jgi:DNA-directed RNA polymerase specialized sigma24 family protein/ribosome-associated translation inhibitor RaiA
MILHFSYKLTKTPDLEKAVEQQIQKLRKRLQVFRPDLVSLNGTIDEGAKGVTTVSLNLHLPSAQLAAQESADRPVAAIKAGFERLLEQLTKHKDLLRSQYKWPRVRGMAKERPLEQVPFEDTIAAVKSEKISDDDVSSYVNLNLPRLQRFVERELRYREASGRLRQGQISPNEVVDEAISHALDDHAERPEKVTLEPWLYRLATRSIDRLTNQTRTENGSVPLETQMSPSRQKKAGEGSDEAWMQFHQPDEMFTNGDLVADYRAATPEDIAATDEMVAMVEVALSSAKKEDREAFILFTMEGFTMNEIALITNHKPEQVRASIAAARDHLRKSFPSTNKLKDKLVEQTKSA